MLVDRHLRHAERLVEYLPVPVAVEVEDLLVRQKRMIQLRFDRAQPGVERRRSTERTLLGLSRRLPRMCPIIGNNTPPSMAPDTP